VNGDLDLGSRAAHDRIPHLRRSALPNSGVVDDVAEVICHGGLPRAMTSSCPASHSRTSSTPRSTGTPRAVSASARTRSTSACHQGQGAGKTCPEREAGQPCRDDATAEVQSDLGFGVGSGQQFVDDAERSEDIQRAGGTSSARDGRNGSGRRSTTRTRAPWAEACNATARPVGPAPTTRTSASPVTVFTAEPRPAAPLGRRSWAGPATWLRASDGESGEASAGGPRPGARRSRAGTAEHTYGAAMTDGRSPRTRSAGPVGCCGDPREGAPLSVKSRRTT